MSNIMGPSDLELEPLAPCVGRPRQFATQIKDKLILNIDENGGCAYSIEKRKWLNQHIPSCTWDPAGRHKYACSAAGNFIFMHGGSYSMGEFDDIMCLELAPDADDETIPLTSGRWTYVMSSRDERLSSFMAPCGENNLLVYGGIEDVDRFGYDENGDFIDDNRELSSPDSEYVDSQEEKKDEQL